MGSWGGGLKKGGRPSTYVKRGRVTNFGDRGKRLRLTPYSSGIQPIETRFKMTPQSVGESQKKPTKRTGKKAEEALSGVGEDRRTPKS